MTKTTSQDEAPSDGEDTADIEALMQQIDAILARMEAPDAPLEATVRDFESGMALMRRAQDLLSSAEQRVEILLSEHATGNPSAE